MLPCLADPDRSICGVIAVAPSSVSLARIRGVVSTVINSNIAASSVFCCFKCSRPLRIFGVLNPPFGGKLTLSA